VSDLLLSINNLNALHMTILYKVMLLNAFRHSYLPRELLPDLLVLVTSLLTKVGFSDIFRPRQTKVINITPR